MPPTNSSDETPRPINVEPSEAQVQRIQDGVEQLRATISDDNEALALSSIRQFLRRTEVRTNELNRSHQQNQSEESQNGPSANSPPRLQELPPRIPPRWARPSSMLPSASLPARNSGPNQTAPDGPRASTLVQNRYRQRNRESSSASTTSSRNRPSVEAYGNRIPTLRPGERQSLYDWAPLSFSPSTELHELNEAIMAAGLTTPEELRDILTQHGIISREHLPRAPSPPESASTQTRTSPRDHVIRYPRNRDRGETSHTSSRRRTNAQASSQPGARWPAWYDAQREGSTNDGNPDNELPPLRSRTGSLRNTPSRPVEDAIKYLTKLRSRSSQDDAFPAEIGALHDEDFPLDDFLIDTSILSVEPTSWLAIGGLFTGSQYAAQSTSYVSRRLTSPTTFDNLIPATYLFPESSPLDGAISSSVTRSGDDKWDVQVNIHSINYDTMQVSGSMKASGIPDWQAPGGKSSINTYWEGEIVDFQQHGLETLNFTSTPQIDGTYWRKLEPFAGLSDLELAQKLVSKKFLKELSEKWILMRWKEKCFVTPSSDTGLTISGFYFLCLDRENGHIEGFYFDPASSPYQQLSLKPEPKVFTSYEFR